MLEGGNGKMTTSENQAHFSMWSMLAARLIAGIDLRTMKKEIVEILPNREVIAIDQDSLGIQGYRYDATDSLEV
jgi:alpha-galactosidase